MKIIVLLLLVFLAANANAATILVGSDGSDYADTNCWQQALTLENCHWKASRYQAKNTGTIGYFRMRVASTPTGCTNDSGCWAIYEGGTASSLGALKAWTCFTGYDWTTTGAGWHDFAAENIETNATITAGQYYWVVFHSYAVDGTHYATAGCNAYIPAYRGTANDNCDEVAGLYWTPPNIAGYAETQCGYSSPPAPEAFETAVATYVMWGVWASNGTVPRMATGVTISGGKIE